MNCTYTLTVPGIVDVDVDIVTAIIANDQGFANTYPLNDLPAFIDLIKGISANFSPNVPDVAIDVTAGVLTVVISNSDVVYNSAEWNFSGNEDGGGFVKSACQVCDYSIVDLIFVTPTNLLYSLCNQGGCIVNLGKDLFDVAGVLEALTAYYVNAASVAYSVNVLVPGVMGQATIRVNGNTDIQAPTKIQIYDGDFNNAADIPFTETNCAFAVASPCSPLLCDDANLSILSWINKIIAKTAGGEYGISTIEESASDNVPACDELETWKTILKSALREDNDCLKLAITVVEQGDFLHFDCNEFISPDSIAKRLKMVDGGGCVSIRAIEMRAGETLDCETGLPTLTMFKTALLVDGEKLAIGFNGYLISSCERRCDEPRTEMLLRNTFISDGLNYLMRFLA